MEDFHRNNFITIIDKTLTSFLKSIVPLAMMFFSKNSQSINIFHKITYDARYIFTNSNLSNNQMV